MGVSGEETSMGRFDNIIGNFVKWGDREDGLHYEYPAKADRYAAEWVRNALYGFLAEK